MQVPVRHEAKLNEPFKYIPSDGPVVRGQKPEACGHFYPDVVGVSALGQTALHCVFCGLLNKYTLRPIKDLTSFLIGERPIPSGVKREKLRQKLRQEGRLR